ncbi:AAA family ATPase [Pyrobaculum sp.]|uniref:AAA family ATPase n=1 Tax=Pyrobaculum sp. TaxID=2004705 RepID=UPI003161CDB4
MCTGFEDCGAFFVEASGDVSHVGKFLWSPADKPWKAMEEIRSGDCVLHYVTEKAGVKGFVGVSKAAEPAKQVDKAESERLFQSLGVEPSYYSQWLSKHDKFYFVPLKGFRRFDKPLGLEEVVAMGISVFEVVPQNYIRKTPYGKRILEAACRQSGPRSCGGVDAAPSDELEKFVALLMLAGKNVLFVGAPGVGKTLLARRAACFFTECPPMVEAGREDLAYEDLAIRYAVGPDGRVERRLGSLARAVAESWASLRRGGGPCHFIIDEINRANIDVVMGRFFTVLDMEHRSVEIPELEEAGVDPPRVPLSFRVFATMNVVDRGQLFRMSFALLRRFAYVYVLPPHKKIEPEKSPRETAKELGLYRPYAEAAYKALTLKSDLENDVATLIRLPIPQPEKIAEEADRLGILHLVDHLLESADKIGLEVGPSMIVDVLKAVAVYASAPPSLKPREEVFVDYVVSSLVLPYFAAAIPRIRQKALYTSKAFEEARELNEVASKIREWLGERSASYHVARGLLYELPAKV